MANRRMFSRSVIETDSFLELSHEAQLLYFILGLNADDDGFIGSPKAQCRLFAIDSAVIEELEHASFVYVFESGVILIRHWNLNNTLKNDRHTDTIYKNERQMVEESNKVYFLKAFLDTAEPERNQNGTTTEQSKAEQRSEKINRTKSNKDKERVERGRNEKISLDDFRKILEREHIYLPWDKQQEVYSTLCENNWMSGGKPIENIGGYVRRLEQEINAESNQF